MSNPPRNEITTKRIVYPISHDDSIVIRRDLMYAAPGSGPLTMDLYSPPDGKGKHPAVIFVSGYSDAGFQRVLGCRFKEMESYISWSQLLARSGIAAITYTNIEPVSDLRTLVHFAKQNAHSLAIDEDRIGIWACSGNVPNALSLLMTDVIDSIRCAVFCYGYMLDLNGSEGVAEASRQFGFVDPCAGRSATDLRTDTPVFIARAGRDEMPNLNNTIDAFVTAALALNLPLTVSNYREGQHAFDILNDSDGSREIIRQVLAFLRFHLSTA